MFHVSQEARCAFSDSRPCNRISPNCDLRHYRYFTCRSQ